MKWNEAAVAAAVRALPGRTDGKAPDVAETVEMIRFGVWASQGNTGARARPATRKQTVAELKKLCDLCRELHEHIETKMHSPALRMVEGKLRDGSEARKNKGQRPLYHPLLLNLQIEGTFHAARAALIDAKNGADLPQPENRGSKPGAKMLTQVCASAYQSVTGQEPGRSYDTYAAKESGAFVQFLGAVFEALGVDAKPAGQAKVLMEKRAAAKA